ncbi:hypothetical protein V8C42DRAFT_338106, partial [Trichoderma barbatum]
DIINVISVLEHATVHHWVESESSPIQGERYWRQAVDCRTLQLSSVHLTSHWEASLEFPSAGRDRVIVDKADITRLDQGEQLNDNLINFYIHYLKHTLEENRPELLRKVYFFNTYFFASLTSLGRNINYGRVEKWSKVDLFSYDYIIIPINEKDHWYLSILCNIPNAIQDSTGEHERRESSTASIQSAAELINTMNSPRRVAGERELTHNCSGDGTAATTVLPTAAARIMRRHVEGTVPSSAPPFPPIRTMGRKSIDLAPHELGVTQPRIVIFDSLGRSHNPTCTALKEYLTEEAKAKRGVGLTTVPKYMEARGIPEQDNGFNCGVFLLGYLEAFLKDPDESVRKIYLREELEWSINVKEMRTRMGALLSRLFDEQMRLRAGKELHKDKANS